MKRHVLVTGGAGFLGRHVASSLDMEGFIITLLDDLSCHNSTFSCKQIATRNIKCIKGSMFDRYLVEEMVAENDIIVHFSSVVGVETTISQTISTMKNITGTINLVEALTDHHVVIFGSSADVYGLHSRIYNNRAMREDDLLVYEGSSVNRWVYPKVKALEENLITNSKARSINIRIFNSYGPGMDYPYAKRVIPQFIERILIRSPLRINGDGSQKRSFCYYDDTTRGVVLALKHAIGQSTPYTDTVNIGNTEILSVLQLAYLMVDLAIEIGLIDTPLPVQTHCALYSQAFDDSWSRVPDLTHAENILGFKPQVSLEEGLRRTLAYYRDYKL